jgi:hypothetical protein
MCGFRAWAAYQLQRLLGVDRRVTGHNDYDLAGVALESAGVCLCIGRFDVDWHEMRAG